MIKCVGENTIVIPGGLKASPSGSPVLPLQVPPSLSSLPLSSSPPSPVVVLAAHPKRKKKKTINGVHYSSNVFPLCERVHNS